MRSLVVLVVVAACGKSDAPQQSEKEAEKAPAKEPSPEPPRTPRPPPGTGLEGCDKLVAAAKRAETCTAMDATYKDYAKNAVADKLSALASGGSGSAYRSYVEGGCKKSLRSVEQDLAHFKCP